MAKAKSKLVEPIEEVAVEEAVEETVKEAPHDDFIARKLKAINSMEKPEKAQRLANRLLRKARN